MKKVLKQDDGYYLPDIVGWFDIMYKFDEVSTIASIYDDYEGICFRPNNSMYDLRLIR